MKKLFPLLLTSFACYSSIAQNVGINTNTPNDHLDVVGTTHVSEYLKVGNPTAPQSISSDRYQLFVWDGGAYYNGFSVNGCGGGWTGTESGNTEQDMGILQWTDQATRARSNLYSPWVWVPSNVGLVIGELSHWCNTANTWDGIWVEWSINGTSWTKVPTGDFYLGAYTGTAQGSNTTCTGANNQACWAGAQDHLVTAFPINGVTGGTWLQVRFVASSDNFNDGSEYQLRNFGLMGSGVTGTTGGAFATGNIYAENNIYAGSNVLLGDLAEYFPIIGTAKPGDLISMIPNSKDKYCKTQFFKDPNVIGVYSTNPTLTLNDPSSGVPVALQGRVPINVCSENGPIRHGDLLCASKIPGKAMKATSPGLVVARALEDFDGDGNGQILALVQTAWYNPGSGAAQSSGSFYLSKGQKKVKVYDASITAESRVFVSFKDNPEHTYWIANKEEGSFTLELNGKISNDVDFDYFVDNASTSNSNSTVRTKNKTTNKVDLANTNSSNTRVTPSILPEPGTIQIPNYQNITPPSVPDPNKSYYWSPNIGLQETKMQEERSTEK